MTCDVSVPMMPSRKSAPCTRGTPNAAHKNGSINTVVKHALQLFCKPFSCRDPDFIPFLGVVFPYFGIQQGRIAERTLVHDAIDEVVRGLLASGFFVQQPEIFEILQSPALRFQADARNRLMITHHSAAID